MRLLKSVNFGIDSTGLSTIGYTLINDDGSEKQTRTTSACGRIEDRLSQQELTIL